MKAQHLLIVNPRSANRSTGRQWPKMEQRLRAVLPPFDAVLTTGPADATRLASEGAANHEVVVAVGGDGTTNEVVNGLVSEGGSVASGVALGVIPRGTGCDFVRSLGVPASLEGAASVLLRGQQQQIDVGRARFLGLDGAPATRYFINAAEVGMGAAVSDAVNRASRRPGGAAAFWWAILTTMIRYRDEAVSLSVDQSPTEPAVLSNAWVSNGRYSGGGILSAREARLDDGLLDLVWVAHLGLLQRFKGLLKLRSGDFVDLPQVQYRKVHRLEVSSERPVPIETDGDRVGTVPATFDVLPERLPVIA